MKIKRHTYYLPRINYGYGYLLYIKDVSKYTLLVQFIGLVNGKTNCMAYRRLNNICNILKGVLKWNRTY